MYNNKEIIELIKKEISANNIDTNLMIINKINYYKSDFFKQNLKLVKNTEKISYMQYPFIYSGLYSSENNVLIIFLNNCKISFSILKKEFTLLDLSNILRVLYHEIMHYKQANIRYNQTLTTTTFLYEMEDIIADYDKLFYKKKHDEFFIEIEANVYAFNELKKYIINANIKDKKILDNIDKNKIKYINRLKHYNFVEFFNKFLECCQKNQLYRLNKFRLIEMFFENDGSYKDVYQVAKNKNFSNLNFYMKVLILKTLYTIDKRNDYNTILNRAKKKKRR